MGGVALKELNTLEVTFLVRIDFRLLVKPVTFAKYGKILADMCKEQNLGRPVR